MRRLAREGKMKFLLYGVFCVLCGVGLGGGIAFFILVVMGFFEPLVTG